MKWGRGEEGEGKRNLPFVVPNSVTSAVALGKSLVDFPVTSPISSLLPPTNLATKGERQHITSGGSGERI